VDRYVYTASLLFDCACKMKFQVAGCLALVAVACRSSETAADANAVVQVKLAVAAVQPFEDKVGSIGTVQVHSGHFASLSAPSPARITTIYVSVGQMVSRGSPLIAFEQTPFIAAAQSAEAALAAAQRGVKLGLISATVAPKSSRLRWPTRHWSAPAYRALNRVGTISEEDGERLELLGARPEAIAVTGDTRYDSVAERAERIDRTREPLARLAAVAPDTFTIVAGSTWPSDEAVLLPAFADLLVQLPTARLLLAPHEPNPDHLAGIAERLRHLKLPRPVRLSQLEHAKAGPVIVVDRVGVLADLYALGDTAFVGGGFHRAGLHSVLEPAVFGVPIAFGPHWQMSRDAALLLDQGGAIGVPSDGRHPLHSQWLVWHHDPTARKKAGKAAKQMVEDGRGASERTTALVRSLVQS